MERKDADRSYPGPVSINGDPSYIEQKELLLNTMIKRRVTEKVFLWQVSSHSADPGASKGKGSESEVRYVLNLESVSRLYMDCIQLKFTVHDENDKLCALYYAKLNSLFHPSKRGKDISFALGEEKSNQYILHLQVHKPSPRAGLSDESTE